WLPPAAAPASRLPPRRRPAPDRRAAPPLARPVPVAARPARSRCPARQARAAPPGRRTASAASAAALPRFRTDSVANSGQAAQAAPPPPSRRCRRARSGAAALGKALGAWPARAPPAIGSRREDALRAPGLPQTRAKARAASTFPTRQARFGNVLAARADRTRTRLNSSHVKISYAVFCLKKKNNAS